MTGLPINVIGAGYVGLVTAVGLASLKHRVIVSDIDDVKIKMLQSGVLPMYEPGLKDLFDQTVQLGLLSFTSEAIEASHYFICVGTPELPDGSCDLSFYWEAARNIISIAPEGAIIVSKSTVPVGTNKKLMEQYVNGGDCQLKVVSNPEFLREGSAIHDFFYPDRIVVGGCDSGSIENVSNLYKDLIRQDNRRSQVDFVKCDFNSSEMIKHASNAYLATRLSFVNELAMLCGRAGANIESVTYGMGLDARIGPLFLKAGPGWGGSCFPKDTKELLHLSNAFNRKLSLVEAAIHSNANHKKALADSIIHREELKQGAQITVLGLSFKAHTDDIRESPSLELVERLILAGFSLVAYDPMSIENFAKLGLDCDVAYDLMESVTGAEAVVIMTEWPEFADMNLGVLRSRMSGNTIYDFRNVISAGKAEEAGMNLILLGA